MVAFKAGNGQNPSKVVKKGSQNGSKYGPQGVKKGHFGSKRPKRVILGILAKRGSNGS